MPPHKRKNTAEEPRPVKRQRVDNNQSSAGPSYHTTHHHSEQKRISGPSKPHLQEGQNQEKGKGKEKSKEARKEKSKAKGKEKGHGNSKLAAPVDPSTAHINSNAPQRRAVVHKLAPPRPFPTVPTSVSASGPKSAHKEGKNFICVTRHTSLATYLGRCKTLFQEGYKTLHLHAMGAAIPHLATLAISLPPILPFPRSDIKVDVRTGTSEVTDEIIPEEEDQDISFRTRAKSSLSVVIRVVEASPVGVQAGQKDKEADANKEAIVFQEQEQEDDETD